MVKTRLSRRTWLSLVVAVLAGAAAAAVLTGCVREEEPEDSVQGLEQVTTSTPESVPFATASPPTSQPTVDPAVTLVPLTPTVEPAVTPAPLTPTAVGPTPFVKPTVTPAPTPTPQPGVCPTPYRQTPEDFSEPPALRPASEIPGQRFQGGVPFSEAYVTVHLPAGREFVISSAWSQDESNLVISIYDAQNGSSLGLRGDGCETGRLVRDSAADAAFNEMMKTLEVEPTYVCPTPVRLGPEEAGPAIPESKMPGQRVEGGAPVEVPGATLHLPAGREFIVSVGTADPGSAFLSLYDVQSGSTLGIRLGDGCELRRAVRDLVMNATFDQVVQEFQSAVR